MKTITPLIGEQFVACDDLNEYLAQLSSEAAVYLGHLLGFYQALSDNTPLTAYEIAVWTDSHETFVYQWLEQQAAAGLLEIDDPFVAGPVRRFRLLPTQKEGAK